MGLHIWTATNVHKLWDYISGQQPMNTSYGLTYHDINQCTQAMGLHTLTATNEHKLWDYISGQQPMYTSYGITYLDSNQ